MPATSPNVALAEGRAFNLQNQQESMKIRERHVGRYGQEAFSLLPPNLQSVGPLAFTESEFLALDAWLAESGWPDGHMDIAMLEGYLVALLIWPIELAPGAWLPRIWGIKGWKVAAKIATRASYDRFVALVLGMFQEVERRLSLSPSERTFVLSHEAPLVSGRYFAGAAWATGFMTALHENSGGLGSRSISVRSAVERIAHFASRRTDDSSSMREVGTTLTEALMDILLERPSKAPGAYARINRSVAVSARGQ